MNFFTKNLGFKLFFCVSLILSLKLTAQTDYKIGTGTTTNTDWNYPCPIPDSKVGTRQQYLYLASELTAAGMGAGSINAIRFNVKSLGDYVAPESGVNDMIIKIGTTSNTALTMAWEPGTTIVSGPLNQDITLGVNSFTFSTPFFWNGADNIIIEICTTKPEYTPTANPYIENTQGLSFNASHTLAMDFEAACENNSEENFYDAPQTTRPNIIFNVTAASPCSGTGLVAGTTVSDLASVCPGLPFKLHLTGTSLATGLTYQWQTSADNATWINIAGATKSSYTGTQTGTSYYRAIVTCATGGTANAVSIRILSPLPLSGTYTINNSLPTGGTNFNSFNDAYSYIKCGINGPVVFNVDAGSAVYNEQLIINTIPGSSIVNTVTFNGNGASIEYESLSTKERAVIKLNGADYLRFNNLTVSAKGNGFSEYGYGFQLLNDADSNIIDHCIINTNQNVSSDGYAGVVIGGTFDNPTRETDARCDGNQVTENTITGGKFGVTLVGSVANGSVANANNRISRNIIHEFDQYGIYLAASIATQIDSNHLSRPGRTGVFNDISGIYLNNINTKIIISKNTITDIYGGQFGYGTFYGIYFNTSPTFGGLEGVVSNNLIYNINGGGTIYGIYNTLSHNIFYYHNTISLDGDGHETTADNLAVGFYQNEATGVVFSNNNISVDRGGPGANTAIWFNSLSSDTKSDRNNLYVTAGAGIRQIGYASGAGRTFLHEWTAASGQDKNSVSAKPMFVNEAAGDLTPANPALNNIGANVGIATDITGAPRVIATPDAGAFEFAPPLCAAPPTPGTATLSKDAVCVDIPVSIELNGNSVGAGQTYQLESSVTETGAYSPASDVSANSKFSFNGTTSLYYRIKVTCSGNSAYSAPLLLTVYPAIPAGTYTINKNAPASATNFTSFNAAYNSLECGIAGPIIFDVVPNSGIYDEQLLMAPIKGASRINTVTFKGNGNTIRFSSDDYEQRAVIKFRGTDHVILDSLIIDATGAGSFGYGVQFLNNADSNVVRRSSIITSTTSNSQDAYAGIVISASDSDPIATGDTWSDANLIENNKIAGGYYGITVVGDPAYFTGFDNFINDNKIFGNKITDFYSSGIYIMGTERSVIENNEISRPTRVAVGTFNGIYANQTNAEMIIRANRIFNPFGGVPASASGFNGMYFDFPFFEIKTRVENNIIYNLNGTGSHNGFYMNGGGSVSFLHNTISMDNKSNTGTGSSNGIYITNNAGTTDFKNNIVTITRGGNGPKHGFYVATGDVIGLSVDNNDYYIKGAQGNNFIGYRNSSRATLAEWQNVTSRDLSSFVADPVYADPASGNFAPTVLPIDNKGTPAGVLNDITGTVRSTVTPDPGAYEFIVASCISGVEAGNSAVTPASGICLGASVTLSLSGNSTSGTQYYQWQRASSAAGPWVNIGDSLYVPTLTTITNGMDYFRAVVTCSGSFSDISSVSNVALNSSLPGGVYTIIPDGTGNYKTFNEAVSALGCGIAGPVTFNVAPGTYNEQVYMRSVGGASATNRVTFRSANGIASSVTLTFAGTSAANYTLKLDSANYITYRNISIEGTSATNGRAVELAGTSSYDSISNNIITTPLTTGTTTARAGIFGSPVTGNGIVISGNTVNNGTIGIYIAGNNVARSTNVKIEGNTVKGYYQYGIYTSISDSVSIAANAVIATKPLNATSYGIYTASGNGWYHIAANDININNTTTTVYGLYATGLNAAVPDTAKIEGNRIVGVTANTGVLYGLYTTGLSNSTLLNNVVNIKTSAASSYGLYVSSNTFSSYYNNSIYSTSTSSTNNIAAFFTAGNEINFADVKNNIFAHGGGGRAMLVNNVERIYSDYNMLYTSGSTLVQLGSTLYASLKDWNNATGFDLNSIVYKPAFATGNNLLPDLNDSSVWAMHGRGIQVPGNNHDFNNSPRPVSLIAGVPDLGAYEFLPVALPGAAKATPLRPAPGIIQVFTLGTDTVASVKWGATVPDSIAVKRYSGVMPPSLPAGNDYMYFYTDADVFGSGAYTYSIDQRYLDPWRGLVNNEARIRLGKTAAAGTWSTDVASTVNTADNIISQTGLTFMDKFTGLTNATVPSPAIDTIRADSSNIGTRFWVGYGHIMLKNIDSLNINVGGSERDANVTIRINGTSWIRRYKVPAHTFLVSEAIPKTGGSGALLRTEGLSDRGISIESDEPIAAYAHTHHFLSAAATTLLPVNSYGYEYYALSYLQKNYDLTERVYSWFYVISDHDSTMVEITPVNPTEGGRKAGVPFNVILNKGEVYQVLGARKSQDDSYDMSGSKIRSFGNQSGKCYPVAVFSGNTSAYIDCPGESFNPAGSYLVQQALPAEGWGNKYLTAPTSSKTGASESQNDFYRILVKDPSTVVKVNGTALTGLISNKYYTYQSTKADYIEADKPVMVAQYIPGFSACDLTGSGPEMFYLAPAEQGVKKATFFRTDKDIAGVNSAVYLTVIIPTAGVSSLKIDGSSTFDLTYPHPNKAGYTVAVKRWKAENGTSTVESDSAFTGITYGQSGYIANYGYLIGRMLPGRIKSGITNVYDSTGNFSPFACVGTSVKVSVLLPVQQPTSIIWKFSAVPNMGVTADSVQINPLSKGTATVDGTTYYRFDIQKEFSFSAPGDYTIPVVYTHPVIDNCTNSKEKFFAVKVIGAPKVEFTATSSVCLKDAVVFVPVTTLQSPDVKNKFIWSFGDNTASSIENPTKTYTAAGTFSAKLTMITKAGCMATDTKPVTKAALIGNPVVVVGNVDIHTATFAWTAVAGVTNYQVSVDGGANWITPSSGATGVTHTITGVPGNTKVTLQVKAVDPNTCKDGIGSAEATTLMDMVFIPNAFTPNNDGKNETFKISGGYDSGELMIFNQWGQKIFVTTDLAKGWDGKNDGKLQPSGVYLYVCTLVLQNGTKEVRKGYINLVR